MWRRDSSPVECTESRPERSAERNSARAMLRKRARSCRDSCEHRKVSFLHSGTSSHRRQWYPYRRCASRAAQSRTIDAHPRTTVRLFQCEMLPQCGPGLTQPQHALPPTPSGSPGNLSQVVSHPKSGFCTPFSRAPSAAVDTNNRAASVPPGLH